MDLDRYPPDRPSGGHRLAEVRQLSAEMEQHDAPSEGQFSAFGMLITDSALAADGDALAAAHDGLQWLHRRYATRTEPADDVERRGRLLGLMDVTHWALRRLPGTMQISLDPAGHAGRFLHAVAARPGLSNSDLTKALQVNETEISRVGRRLLAAGLVWKRKEWRRNVWDVTPRGQHYLQTTGSFPEKRDPVAPRFAVGVKLLPTRFIGVVTDAAATVQHPAKERSLSPLTVDEVADELAGFVRELIDQVPEAAACSRAELTIGVEIGGHVSARNGEIVYAPNYAPHGDWTGLALAEQVESILGIRTVIENDANSLALLEQQHGDNVGLGSSAVVVLDEGVGCGIIANHQLVHGFAGSAGEIGHVVVQPNGPECRCQHRGCMESVAGSLAIVDAVTKSGHTKVADLADVAKLVARRNKAATKAVRAAGEALGRGISALLNLANPQRVILYAPAELIEESRHQSAMWFMTAAREATERYTFSTAGTDYQLTTKVYRYEDGARAAAAVALLRRADGALAEAVD